jgi:hypothetical protein
VPFELRRPADILRLRCAEARARILVGLSSRRDAAGDDEPAGEQPIEIIVDDMGSRTLCQQRRRLALRLRLSAGE